MAKKFEETSATTGEFTFELLEEITDDFSDENIIGRGAYGVVYMGELDNGEKIALKKLHNVQGLDDTDFMNEYNNLIGAQHPNITRLIGYCFETRYKRVFFEGKYVFPEVRERVLCLEYLHGGSLDKHISAESCGLDWHTRFKIIVGVCEGLNYLHNGCKPPMYHLDLKPENILLDKNLVPKIADFGLSRLFPSDQTCVTGKMIGTLGYIPPEFINGGEITSKYDVFSLGVIIIRIMSGHEAYSTCAEMSPQEFHKHVHANWEKQMQATMSLDTSKQIETCIKIALRCLEFKRENRPTIAEIVDDLSKIYTAETSLTGQIDKDVSIEQLMQKGFGRLEEKEDEDQNPNSGGIVFSTNYSPPVPLDIFSSAVSPSSTNSEVCLTDGMSYNYNGRSIPQAALKTLLKIPKLADQVGATDADVDAGQVSGLVFVSERDDGLETLYIALRFNANAESKVKVFALADIFGAADFSGARLEDSGCIGGGYSVGSRTVDHCLIYVSTKDPVPKRRSPWTVVYKTSLSTGKTERLTPRGMFDLNPAVSPSGKMVAVASFQSKSWNDDEVENRKTDIYVMNVDSEEHQDHGRKQLIKDGGWPSWGSDNIIFFHRVIDDITSVVRYNIRTNETTRVTPWELDAVTPAAISETKVAVATIREKSKLSDVRTKGAQYRHIEIFDTNLPLWRRTQQITQKMRPLSDHYNPFVLDGECHIGYHRGKSDLPQQQEGDKGLISASLHKIQSPVHDVGLYRVSGMLPTISSDGSKVALVDSESKEVWLADNQGLRLVYKEKGSDRIFSPVWNQNPNKNILYVCAGPSFHMGMPLQISALHLDDGSHMMRRRLTSGDFNNAFPSSSPDGNQIVYRSARMDRDTGERLHKNLYIMDAELGEFGEGMATRLTQGEWTDTQCQWSPNGDWIVFSSTRDKPFCSYRDAELYKEPRHFSVFLVKPSDPSVVIRVMDSHRRGGHISNPVFSPNGRSIAVTADLALVSVDPISLPTYLLAVPHCDIFMVDIDPDNPRKSKDVKGFRRVTHSRYHCGTPAWSHASMEDLVPVVQFLQLTTRHRSTRHRSTT